MGKLSDLNYAVPHPGTKKKGMNGNMKTNTMPLLRMYVEHRPNNPLVEKRQYPKTIKINHDSLTL